MMNPRTLAISAFVIAFMAQGAAGQGRTYYRNFQLGADLATVSTLTGVATSEAKTIHQRPVVLQDLEWRPPYSTSGTMSASTDPVEEIVFSFYNDQLFRIVVDYIPERTAGMTQADMVEAISKEYGATVKRPIGAARVASRIETESGTALARWGDAGHGVVLYRTGSYRQPFRLIVTATAVDDLARKATSQAMRLDEQEAPSREIARQKQERDDSRVAAEKARLANKGTFRP